MLAGAKFLLLSLASYSLLQALPLTCFVFLIGETFSSLLLVAYCYQLFASISKLPLLIPCYYLLQVVPHARSYRLLVGIACLLLPLTI